MLQSLKGKRKSKRRSWKRRKQNALPNTKKIEKNDIRNTKRRTKKRLVRKQQKTRRSRRRKRRINSSLRINSKSCLPNSKILIKPEMIRSKSKSTKKKSCKNWKRTLRPNYSKN
jgi:hypothetical protein